MDTLTLSVEQKMLAEERVRERGLVGRVRVHLLDYRDIPQDWKHAFDAFVSIEMLEHVGSKVRARLSLSSHSLPGQMAEVHQARGVQPSPYDSPAEAGV